MEPLDELVAKTLAQPVPREITAMADHLRSSHEGVLAVIAYGSCLRGVATTDSLIDLYLLTRDFRGVSSNAMSRLGCHLAPPNVYYAEHEFDCHRFRAKYAVLPLAQFGRWMTASNPYFWARFCQPSALVFAADEASRMAAVAAIVQAARTMYGHAQGLSRHEASSFDSLAAWQAGFRATYRTELRAESGGSRAAHVVEANADYYRALSEAMTKLPPIAANWTWKTVAGKLWAALRLIKASFTFTGGADYVAWKIERHTGLRIALSPWQRRHPVIAGLALLPRLLLNKTVR